MNGVNVISKVILISIFLISSVQSSFSQNPVSEHSNWDFEASSDFYFFTDDFLVTPVIKADNNKLHLEARYNYEDTRTVSLWGGYNFEFGKKLTATITPMAAPVLGNTNGIAPGLELTLDYGDFEFYSESEYLFDLEDKNSSYFYNWSEISFSPLSMCSIGAAAQRTLAYNNDNEFQFGIYSSIGYKAFSIYAYYFNIGKNDDFLMMSADVTF